MPSLTASRYFNFRLALGIPLALMAALLLFYPTSIDFALARPFHVPGQGFIWRGNFWLEEVLHTGVRQTLALLSIVIIGSFLYSLFPTRLRPWRRQLGYLVLAISLSTGIITPLKTLSAVQCPWSLSEFDGPETFSELLSERPHTANPGRCWPGGHASSGFSLLAFFFVFRDSHKRAARVALFTALSLGVACSLGRMAQGAHFLSHNVWTLLLDWFICALCYRWILYKDPRAPQP